MLRLTLSLFALATASDWAAGDEGLNLLQLRAGLATQKVALEDEYTGNDLVARLTPDNAVNIEFVDRGAGPFADAGILSSVRFYVQRPGNKGLRYRIYRPAGGGFTLVGQTEAIDITAAVGAIQQVTFAEPVAYEAGDYIGWCHDADGNIPFDTGGGTVSWEYNKNSNLGVSRGFGAGGARTYSYEVAEAPTTTTTPPPPADEAAAEGDPHLTFANGKKRDLEPADLSMISEKVEQPQENKGYAVTNRFSVDGVENCEFIDFGAGAFAADGAIYGIRYYVKRAGDQHLRYRIYRPTTKVWSNNPYYKTHGTDIEFTFVAQTEELDCSAVGLKEVTFAEPVEYKAGDYIGWGHDGNGNIAFDSTDQGVPRTSDSWVAWARVPKNDNVGTGTQFVNGPGFRQHSYQLICEPPATTTTAPAIEEPVPPDDDAEAVGDPHVRTTKNKHYDLE